MLFRQNSQTVVLMKIKKAAVMLIIAVTADKRGKEKGVEKTEKKSNQDPKRERVTRN